MLHPTQCCVDVCMGTLSPADTVLSHSLHHQAIQMTNVEQYRPEKQPERQTRGAIYLFQTPSVNAVNVHKWLQLYCSLQANRNTQLIHSFII